MEGVKLAKAYYAISDLIVARQAGDRPTNAAIQAAQEAINSFSGVK